jgi:hypothetical protein
MQDNVKDRTVVALRLVQIPEEEFVRQIVKYIVDNQFPFYPGNYVKTINLKTGVQQEKVRQIFHAIHKPEYTWWIYEMVTLTIVKFAVGKPDGSGDLSSRLQSYYRNKMIPAEIEKIDANLSKSMMLKIKFGDRPYGSYSDIWKKRLNLVVWSAVEYNVTRYVQSNKIA